MIPEREREALMRLTMCAREECSMCKYQGDCNFDFQYELATKNMNILAEALRKLSNSEKPNNCEHITEDGVTCAKYPACDDCLDNPLNKVKGSERLVKGKDEPQTIRCPKCGRSDYIREFGKDFSVTAEEAGFKYKCINCNTYIEPQSDRKTEPTISKMEQVDKDINVRSKDEPSNSEKPNNCKWSVEYAKEMLDTMPCEECGHWEHGAGDHYYCALLEMRQECCFESKGESTLMFANKPKDEPQKIGYCNECKWFRDKQVCGRCRSKNLYAPKDEPTTQTETQNSNVISVYDGVSEAVRCAMCNKSYKGCDGACSYDEKLYKRIMDAINESRVDTPQTEREGE